jgi:predicted transcriptional regulator YheO
MRMFSSRDMDLFSRLAKGIARHFGPNCEVAVHDLTSGVRDSTIVIIENGHVTGRSVGDGPSHVVLTALMEGETAEDHLCYLTKTADGKILKSSTIFLRDENGAVIGVMALNFDISLMLAMEETLQGITLSENTEREPEKIPQNVSDLLDELIGQSVRVVGKPVALMSREDKVHAIRFLRDTGAFLITKSGDRVSKYFGISKFTLYNYLDEGKERDAE